MASLNSNCGAVSNDVDVKPDETMGHLVDGGGDGLSTSAVCSQCEATVIVDGNAGSDQSTPDWLSDEHNIFTKEHHMEEEEALSKEAAKYLAVTESLVVIRVRNRLLEVMKWLERGAANFTRYRLNILRRIVEDQSSVLDCLLHRGFMQDAATASPPNDDPGSVRISPRKRELQTLAELLEEVKTSMSRIKAKHCFRGTRVIRKQLVGHWPPSPTSHNIGLSCARATKPKASTDQHPLKELDIEYVAAHENVELTAALPVQGSCDVAAAVRPVTLLRCMPIANQQPLAFIEPNTMAPALRPVMTPRRRLSDYRILMVNRDEIFYPGSPTCKLWQTLEDNSSVPKAVFENVDAW